jgi:Cdc6-like AAA superfamily ATPase
VTDIQDRLDSVINVVTNVGKVLHDREQQAILDWLTPADYSSQQNDFFGRRQQGTGEWLLKSDEFQQWENSGNRILFCPGIPGAGKTMITSIVVNHLCKEFGNNHGIGIAFLYCNFRQQQEQQPINLFLNLLKQFAQRTPAIPECVTRLYRDHKGNQTRPSFEEIATALHSVITGYSRSFIIIDALDEYSGIDGVVSQFLVELFGLQAKTRSSLFATSRPIFNIPEEFKRRQSTTLEIYARNEDIRIYLDGYIHRVSSFVRETPEIEEKIKAAIIKAADGMYV